MPKMVVSTEIRELGDNILQKRLKHNLTQEQLGNLVGITGNTIHLYESAQSVMKVDKLFLLIEALGCNPNDICPKHLNTKQLQEKLHYGDLESKFFELNEANQQVILNTVHTLINGLLEQQKKNDNK